MNEYDSNADPFGMIKAIQSIIILDTIQASDEEKPIPIDCYVSIYNGTEGIEGFDELRHNIKNGYRKAKTGNISGNMFILNIYKQGLKTNYHYYGFETSEGKEMIYDVIGIYQFFWIICSGVC